MMWGGEEKAAFLNQQQIFIGGFVDGEREAISLYMQTGISNYKYIKRYQKKNIKLICRFKQNIHKHLQYYLFQYNTENVIHTGCEFLLGILTIPDHSALRNISRNSWIRGLPKNVCYTFLFDNEESMDVKEKDDGISLNSKYRGREVRRG